MDIKHQGLLKLDAANDDHWTSDGAPRLDVVSELLGVDVTREQVIEADPFFTRESVVAAEEPDDGTLPEAQEEAEASEMTEADLLMQSMRMKQAQIDEAGKDVDKAQGVMKRLVAQMDVLAKQADKLTRAKLSYQPFADYLASQNQMRIDRAAMHMKALEATNGIRTTGKSPLDQAYTRKNIRGAQRPQVPLKTGT